MTLTEQHPTVRRPHRPNPKQLRQAVADWNLQHGIGRKVKVTKDDGDTVVSRTSSMAWIMGDHSAVIMIEGIVGAYRLDRCQPITGAAA